MEEQLEVLEEANGETLTQSLNHFLEAKHKLTMQLIRYIEDGKIDWQKHPNLVVAKASFFEEYVRHKYNWKEVIDAAKSILTNFSSTEELRERLVDLVCKTSTSEKESGSLKYTVQTVIRRAYNSFWGSCLKAAEEHAKQQQDLAQVEHYELYHLLVYLLFHTNRPTSYATQFIGT